MRALNANETVLYNHWTRGGTPYEMTEQLNQLREGMNAGDRQMLMNRKAVVAAINKLMEKINPPQTETEQAESAVNVMIEAAQKSYDDGDDAGAKRILHSAGVDLDSLEPRSDAFVQREADTQRDYLTARRQAVTDTKKYHGMSTEDAEVFVTDRMDAGLQRTANLNHGMPIDRPIEIPAD